MRAFKILCGIVCLQILGATPLWAATAAGTASIVAGPVSARAPDGSTRALAKDDAVYSGDRILTGPGGYVRLGFLDGGSMVLRPNTEFAIEGFRFQPGVVESQVQLVPSKTAPAAASAPLTIGTQDGVGNQAFFRLIRGGFRAVSGLVGKLNREEYAVRTPVATIGIRGTVFWSVVCDATCAADPMVQAAVAGGEQAAGGTVSAVNQGSIVMVSNVGQSVAINSAEFVFTTAAGAHVALPGLPGFMAGEAWLNSFEPTAATSTSPPSPLLADSALSVVPAVGSIAATVLIGAVVLGTDNGDGAGTSPGTTTTTTSTGR